MAHFVRSEDERNMGSASTRSRTTNNYVGQRFHSVALRKGAARAVGSGRRASRGPSSWPSTGSSRHRGRRSVEPFEVLEAKRRRHEVAPSDLGEWKDARRARSSLASRGRRRTARGGRRLSARTCTTRRAVPRALPPRPVPCAVARRDDERRARGSLGRDVARPRRGRRPAVVLGDAGCRGEVVSLRRSRGPSPDGAGPPGCVAASDVGDR